MWNNQRGKIIILIISILIVITALFSARYGAVKLSLDDILQSFDFNYSNKTAANLNQRIFMNIRLPRILLCLFVGAGLAVGGVLLQSLFQNPIVEPGLIGTSSGAALGAAFYFVAGESFLSSLGSWALPLAACLGGIISTAIVFMLASSKHEGKSSILLMLLTGLAINALCMSGIGFLSYIARDPQARSITFWGMGTFSGSNWNALWIVGTTTIISIIVSLRYAKDLNALMLGDSEANILGVNTNKLKIRVLLINVIMVAVATSFVGVISFVGLIVPHILRMLQGSNNRFLIIGSALLGGFILCLADFFARIIVSPAELPIGIITSLVGVPIFIYLLRKNTYLF
jgi:iron complex transport system permease protein